MKSLLLALVSFGFVQSAFASYDVPFEIAESIYANLPETAVLRGNIWVKENSDLQCIAFPNRGAGGYKCTFLRSEIFDRSALVVRQALPVEAVLEGNIWVSEYKNLKCLAAPGHGATIHKCKIQ